MSSGKRVGSRRAPKQRGLPRPRTMAYCLGITLSVVAWGYLVRAAIDFGSSAREGESNAWAFLALACVGAAACLFAALILGTRLLRALGIISAAAAEGTEPPVLRVLTTEEPEFPELADEVDLPDEPPVYRGKRAAR